MTPEKAIELASKYDPLTVVLILIIFFFAGFILYVMRVQERRENRLFDVIEKKMKDNEERMQERHIANQEAMAVLAEADKRQREEHNKMISLLDSLVLRIKT